MLEISETDAAEENTLFLSVSVRCDSSSKQILSRCGACCKRENCVCCRLRTSLIRSDPDPTLPSPSETGIISTVPPRARVLSPSFTEITCHSSALVVFGNIGLLDFRNGCVKLRPRVTCYPKHHGEDAGFLCVFELVIMNTRLEHIIVNRLHFTMTDSSGHLVGSGTTHPIQIIAKPSTRRRAASQHQRGLRTSSAAQKPPASVIRRSTALNYDRIEPSGQHAVSVRSFLEPLTLEDARNLCQWSSHIKQYRDIT